MAYLFGRSRFRTGRRTSYAPRLNHAYAHALCERKTPKNTEFWLRASDLGGVVLERPPPLEICTPYPPTVRARGNVGDVRQDGGGIKVHTAGHEIGNVVTCTHGSTTPNGLRYADACVKGGRRGLGHRTPISKNPPPCSSGRQAAAATSSRSVLRSWRCPVPEACELDGRQVGHVAEQDRFRRRASRAHVRG